MNNLCKDNLICCDDNCQRCANLIYNELIATKLKMNQMINELKAVSPHKLTNINMIEDAQNTDEG